MSIVDIQHIHGRARLRTGMIADIACGMLYPETLAVMVTAFDPEDVHCS